jgi:hypothetical protein
MNQPGSDQAGDDTRRFLHEARGTPYRAVASLNEARTEADFAVVLSGDFGGQVYLTAPAAVVRCEEPALRQLLADIDSIEWDEPEGTSLAFEQLPVGSGVLGGMGGGLVADDVWVHPRLDRDVADAARQVVRGGTPRLPESIRRRAKADRRLP